MASLQAHVLVWLLKLQLKRGLIRSKGDVARMRKLFTPPPFRVPRGVKITPATVGGVAGEWVERAGADLTMLYLHGGGYFACSRGDAPAGHRGVRATGPPRICSQLSTRAREPLSRRTGRCNGRLPRSHRSGNFGAGDGGRG